MRRELMLWRVFPWILGAIVIAVGFYAWIEKGGLVLFPLLGIWAWSIMLTHYVIDEVRRLKPELSKTFLIKTLLFPLYCFVYYFIQALFYMQNTKRVWACHF